MNYKIQKIDRFTREGKEYILRYYLKDAYNNVRVFESIQKAKEFIEYSKVCAVSVRINHFEYKIHKTKLSL